MAKFFHIGTIFDPIKTLFCPQKTDILTKSTLFFWQSMASFVSGVNQNWIAAQIWLLFQTLCNCVKTVLN
jgi:hypothetical protein